MRRVSRLSQIAVAILAVSVMCACSAGPAIEKERLGNLTHAVTQFDASSISSLSCDISGGDIEPQRGFTRLLLVDGRESWQPVLDRFAELGYQGSVNSDSLSLTRSDEILVAGRLVQTPDDQATLVSELVAKGCAIPASGAVMIQFEERAVPISKK